MCYHDSVFNAVKVYLAFENMGIAHQRYYLSRVRCNDCHNECCFRVTKWVYCSSPKRDNDDERLDFSIEAITPDNTYGLEEAIYVHFPAKVAEVVQKSHPRPRSIGEMDQIIRQVMPSRLSQWVLDSFMRGNEYEPEHYLEDPRDFMNRFWRSLQGYCRKILLQERPPVWIDRKKVEVEPPKMILRPGD